MADTTIRISEENKRQLARFGNADESMNDALSRLLSEHDHMAFIGGEPGETDD